MGQVKRAFLGTGLNGAGFAEAACGRGDEVAVWNRTVAKAEALTSFGARLGTDPADAARGATRVHITLTSDAAVDEVIERAKPGLEDGAILLDHSTTAPVKTAARTKRLAAEGLRYLHCPVFMSPKFCREAKGIMLAAGPKALFGEVEADLVPMTGKVMFLGEDPSRAATLKLVGNGMLLSVIGGLSDVLTLAAQQGVEPDQALMLFEHFQLGNVLKGRGAQMAAKNFATSWTLTMARKDLSLMVEAAEGGSLAVFDGLGSRMDALIADGEGEKDVAVLARDVGKKA
ncbi:MAG: NAD(P)-binding domain-containing protein [Myxococcota bacterium]